MKHQICTDQSQSRRLLSCGVDPKTADMCIITYPNGNQQAYVGQVTINAGTIFTDGVLQAENVDLKGEPAWSLSRLISLLPNGIKEDNDPYDEIHKYRLLIYPYLQGWQMEYQYCVDDECHSLICTYGTSLIEACVQMIEYLTQNNYPLNKIEE